MVKWTDDKIVLISEKEYERLNNLQSKIDRAIERIKYEEMFDNDNHHLVDFKEELLDILKEGKE